MIRNRETPGCKSHIMWPTCTSSTCIHHATITSLAAFHLCTISSYTMVMLSRTVHRSCKSWDTWRYRRQQSKSHLQTGRALARWVQQPNRSRRQVCRAEGGSARSLHRSSEYEVRFGHSQLFACSCSRFSHKQGSLPWIFAIQGYRDALKGLDAQSLRTQARAMPNALSLDFILWLADRQAHLLLHISSASINLATSGKDNMMKL